MSRAVVTDVSIRRAAAPTREHHLMDSGLGGELVSAETVGMAQLADHVVAKLCGTCCRVAPDFRHSQRVNSRRFVAGRIQPLQASCNRRPALRRYALQNMDQLPPRRAGRSETSKLRRHECGTTTLEYAVLFVVLIIGALTVWRKLGTTLHSKVARGTERFDHMTGEQLSELGSPAPGALTLPANRHRTAAAMRIPGDGLLDLPTLQKKHVPTAKIDPDDGGTYDLWRTCRDGIAAACKNLKTVNAAQLKDATAFIARAAPDLYDPKNPPKFQWDNSEDFYDNNDGATKGNVITLARGYHSEQQLVNTVAHELQHAKQSRTDMWLTWGQDKANDVFNGGNYGSKHQAIIDRSREIEDKWVDEHP